MHQRFFVPTNKNNGKYYVSDSSIVHFFLNSYNNHNAKNYKKKFHNSHIFVFSKSICFYDN